MHNVERERKLAMTREWATHVPILVQARARRVGFDMSVRCLKSIPQILHSSGRKIFYATDTPLLPDTARYYFFS